MKVFAIKTHKIRPHKESLLEILDKYLLSLKGGSVVAVTSKIVAICEGRVVKLGKIDKEDLIKKEAEYFLPPQESKYNVTLAVKGNLLMPSAGIDESNAGGYYILWPKDP